MILDADLVYKDATLESCSALCVGADGFNCISLDFCPESRTCLLNKESKTGSSSAVTQKDSCYSYKSKN